MSSHLAPFWLQFDGLFSIVQRLGILALLSIGCGPVAEENVVTRVQLYSLRVAIDSSTVVIFLQLSVTLGLPLSSLYTEELVATLGDLAALTVLLAMAIGFFARLIKRLFSNPLEPQHVEIEGRGCVGGAIAAATCSST